MHVVAYGSLAIREIPWRIRANYEGFGPVWPVGDSFHFCILYSVLYVRKCSVRSRPMRRQFGCVGPPFARRTQARSEGGGGRGEEEKKKQGKTINKETAKVRRDRQGVSTAGVDGAVVDDQPPGFCMYSIVRSAAQT